MYVPVADVKQMLEKVFRCMSSKWICLLTTATVIWMTSVSPDGEIQTAKAMILRVIQTYTNNYQFNIQTTRTFIHSNMFGIASLFSHTWSSPFTFPLAAQIVRVNVISLPCCNGPWSTSFTVLLLGFNQVTEIFHIIVQTPHMPHNDRRTALKLHRFLCGPSGLALRNRNDQLVKVLRWPKCKEKPIDL